MSYRRPYRGTQPDYLFPPYASTVKRAFPAARRAAAYAFGAHRTGLRLFRHQPRRQRPHAPAQGRAAGRAYRGERSRAGRKQPAARGCSLKSGRRTRPGATTTAWTSTMRRSIPTSPAQAARSPTAKAAIASSRFVRANIRGATITTPGGPRTSLLPLRAGDRHSVSSPRCISPAIRCSSTTRCSPACRTKKRATA